MPLEPGRSFYRAYGLLFASEIALPFQRSDGGEPDVVVRVGDVPETLGDEGKGRSFWCARQGHFLINHEVAGKAIVCHGREIVVSDAGIDALRVFITGSALSALLQQRGFVTLHASAVAINGRAVAIAGRSGMGKSTTSAALALRGHGHIADDLLALSLAEDGKVLATPAFPSIALWRNALELLGLSVDPASLRMKGVDKYLVPAPHFDPAPVPLSRIVRLERHPLGSCEIEPMTSHEVFDFALRTVHRKRAAIASGAWPEMFSRIGRMANQVEGVSLVRPRDGDTIEEVVAAIENVMTGSPGRKD
ncbi:hypothetical protein [Aurantiacibacter poecillastricola]|uniref:hypothetical protein n=1 Tax=Aurantiacibacter poecillastricola TaxID=3064385 RepID=UPI00273EA26D|nr:hypothetical protein [Aurantiacibacter sp. 219JJ12-13]MDP5263055.1 hypothetical protein [Aurantiacibacter sp. 219JJ12-13]